jgi:hypothetical protein
VQVVQNFALALLSSDQQGAKAPALTIQPSQIKTITYDLQLKRLDAWHIACTLALVGFSCRTDLSICGLAPEEHKSTLGASRAAL